MLAWVGSHPFLRTRSRGHWAAGGARTPRLERWSAGLRLAGGGRRCGDGRVGWETSFRGWGRREKGWESRVGRELEPSATPRLGLAPSSNGRPCGAWRCALLTGSGGAHKVPTRPPPPCSCLEASPIASQSAVSSPAVTRIFELRIALARGVAQDFLRLIFLKRCVLVASDSTPYFGGFSSAALLNTPFVSLWIRPRSRQPRVAFAEARLLAPLQLRRFSDTLCSAVPVLLLRLVAN